MFGKSPPELLGDLESIGLGAFRVVAAQINIGKAPSMTLSNLRAEPVDIVIIASDCDQRGIVDCRAEHFACLQIMRDKDVTIQAQSGGVCRNAVAEISGGCARENIEAKF